MNLKEENKETSDKLDIWHYGLVALDWAAFETEGGKEAEFYKKIIESSGQPALDLGCGSGRLLVPYLQAGLDVDGCDYSVDMLAVCQERLDAEHLTSNLFSLGMHELDLPRRYRTIFACGVVGLGGSKKITRLGMQRVYEHLRPGGTFVFDYFVDWNDPGAWAGRLPENRRSLPLDWFPPQKRTLPNGDMLENAVQIYAVDPFEEISVRRYRLRLWRDGELVKEEIHAMKSEGYTKNELVLMLELAGFEDIQIFGDHTDEPATMDHKNLVFTARK